MTDAAFILGALATITGAWMYAPSAGFIVAGCWLCAVAGLSELGKRKR